MSTKKNDVINEGKVKTDFHSCFSDDYAQNAGTTFEHMKKFIHCMYNIKFTVRDGIIYDTKDECSKQ